MSDTYWLANPVGEKALVDGAEERDRWTRVHGWTETSEPADSDLVYMRTDEMDPQHPIAWGARAYWQGLGWRPSAPPEPVNPVAPVREQEAERVPGGSVDDVKAWVGDDPQRAQQALAAERDRDKPRTTLVDALERIGQPEQDAAPAASSSEE